MSHNRKLANAELNRPDLNTYKMQEKTPLIIVLDNIRSLNNIGSIFRSADAFAVEEVLLCGITAQPPHREINKTALGATESVKWQYFKTTKEAINYLKESSYAVFAIEQAVKSTPLNELKLKGNQKIALIFGHEVKGVNQDIVDLADEVVEIPQKGTKHSLNVAVSAGLVIWEISNKIQFKKNGTNFEN